jgi:hypothetical protein
MDFGAPGEEIGQELTEGRLYVMWRRGCVFWIARTGYKSPPLLQNHLNDIQSAVTKRPH